MKVQIQLASICLLWISLSAATFAQTLDHATIEQQFFKAFVMNSPAAWKVSLGQLEASPNQYPLLLAKGYYGAAGTAMGNQDEDLAEELLDKAEIIIDKILAKDKNSAEGKSLLSAVLGLQIGLSPIKGMLYGSKSTRLASQGIKLAPDSGFTNFVQGNSLFYTPSMFGGDVEESITYLEKASAIYGKQAVVTKWEYMNTLVLLGQAYHQQKAYKKAKTTFETALAIAPDFGWVKQILLPRTEKLMK